MTSAVVCGASERRERSADSEGGSNADEEREMPQLAGISGVPLSIRSCRENRSSALGKKVPDAFRNK